MFKGFFRQHRSNKENEQKPESVPGSGQMDRSQQLHCRPAQNRPDNHSRSGREKRLANHHQSSDDKQQSSILIGPYHHHAPQKKYQRGGTQSCYDAPLGDPFERSNIGINPNRSFGTALALSRHKHSSKREHPGGTRRSYVSSEYGSYSQSTSDRVMFIRELDDSDDETWSSEKIIMELRAELQSTNDRKNYYKDLYKRERQDRIRDRELRDLVEKKLMDDLRRKENECASNQLKIKAWEQHLQHHESFPPPMRECVFRTAHFCTPSTSNTTSTMAGAGEALSSTSELFALKTANARLPITESETSKSESPDETKIFGHGQQLYSFEVPRSQTSTTGVHGLSMSKLQNMTILEEDRQSDTGYGTTSECPSERIIQKASNDGIESTSNIPFADSDR